MRKINGQWFRDRLADAGQSQAALARALDLDTASMSRTMSGKRRVQLDEIEQIAQFLRVPVEDVLEAAGLVLSGRPSVAKKQQLDVERLSDEALLVRLRTLDG